MIEESCFIIEEEEEEDKEEEEEDDDDNDISDISIEISNRVSLLALPKQEEDREEEDGKKILKDNSACSVDCICLNGSNPCKPN